MEIHGTQHKGPFDGYRVRYTYLLPKAATLFPPAQRPRKTCMGCALPNDKQKLRIRTFLHQHQPAHNDDVDTEYEVRRASMSPQNALAVLLAVLFIANV